MRLPAFDYMAPSSLDETLNLLKENGPAAAVLAGGTDLIPRLRQRLSQPDLVISLKNLTDLKHISVEGLTVKIGAAAPLKAVMDHPEVTEQLPGLVEALKSVGAPAVQHYCAAIGGNLLLNTRCLQYNQSQWWRSGREPCFKNGGQACHVLPESKECSAVCMSDGAPMLTALSAQVVLQSAAGARTIPVGDLFSGLGDAPFTINSDELLTEIQVFLPPPGTGAAFRKLRWRSSVDFSLVSAAAVVTMSRGRIDRARLVLGAAGPRPLIVEDAARMLRGQEPTAEIMDQVGLAAQKLSEGGLVDNTIAPAQYRRKMVRVMARRALTAAVKRAEDPKARYRPQPE